MKLLRTSSIPLSLNVLLKGQLKFLKENGIEVVGVSSGGKELKEVAEREGIKVIPLEMQRHISFFKDLISLVRMIALLRREKPEIVHSITPKAGLITMLAGKIAGVPIRMHTYTGLIFPSKNGLMQKVLILMDKLLCWAATDVYPEGNGVKNDLEKFRITSKPLKVLANGNVNGVDVAYFSKENISAEKQNQLRLELDIEAKDFVYVFVGRLVGDKGINELVQAFSELRAENKMAAKDKKIHLILVGPEEWELDPLENKTSAEIKSNPLIHALGFREDVRPYMAVADVYVFPSYREGFPNTVLQAGAMGLPAIVTDINGCNEIIEEDKNGIIIPPKDIVALKNAMSQFLENIQLRNTLAANARVMVAEKYEQSVVWKALLEEYKRLEQLRLA